MTTPTEPDFTPSPRRTLALIGGAFALVIVIMVVVPGALFRLDPRTQILVVQRARLESSGLHQRALETPTAPPVAYFEGDEGRPVMVMIHGFGDHAGTWASLTPALDEDWRVLALDLPGHGESPVASDALTLEPLVDAVARVVEKEAAGEPVVLVGNSLGGLVAMRYTLSHPENVSRVVLLNSAGLAHRIPKEDVYATTPEQFARKLDLIQGERWPTPTPDFVVEGFAEHAAEQVHLSALFDDLATGRHFIDGEVEALQLPITLIWGDDDGFFPMDYARRLDAALPQSTLHVLEGCGHMPQTACPDEVLEIIAGL